MKTYWQDYEGDDESFWEHEFGKHGSLTFLYGVRERGANGDIGTCINTIKPSCYNDYSPQQEVGDYFQKTVDLFKGLDTYKVCISILSEKAIANSLFVGPRRRKHHPR